MFPLNLQEKEDPGQNKPVPRGGEIPPVKWFLPSILFAANKQTEELSRPSAERALCSAAQRGGY